MTPCWCETWAAPISLDLVRRGETWSCGPDCYRRYLAKIRMRAGLP